MYIVPCAWENSNFAFWNFLEFFFPLNIFSLLLIEITDVEPADTEGRL